MSNQCPYLEEGRIIKSCNASRMLLVPSIERFEAYCSGDEHDRCPVLIGHVMRSGLPKAAPAKTRATDCMSWAQK